MTTNANPTIVQKAVTFLQSGIGNTWTNLLVWLDAEVLGVVQDEGQIVSSVLTGMVQEVEAGKSYSQAFADAKAQFITAEVNEGQAVALATLQELATVFQAVSGLLSALKL